MPARILATIILLALCGGFGAAEDVRVAVAANFASTLKAVAPAYENASGNRLRISIGSTGKLYAQIVGGAPFDIFLAADVARPALLEKEGLAVPGTRFTYAVGRLVLWSTRLDVARQQLDALEARDVRHVAMANPRTAPYGHATRQALVRSGLWERVRPRAVIGESVGQVFQFVATGNADAGFVALSQLEQAGIDVPGSSWIVPAELHDPIEQQAVLLVGAESRAAAEDFLSYLRSPATRSILERSGYDTVPD